MQPLITKKITHYFFAKIFLLISTEIKIKFKLFNKYLH